MLTVHVCILTLTYCFANIVDTGAFKDQFEAVYYFPSYDEFLTSEYNKFSFRGEGLEDTALKLTIFSKIESRTALRDPEALWEDGVVPFQLSKDFTEEEKSMIDDVIAEFKRETCVSFVPRTEEKKFLDIETGTGCSAVVGSQAAESVQKLGKGCFQKGILIHEMMHVLGFTHEQNRPDRDEFVKIIDSNIQEDKKSQFKKYSWDEVQTLNFSYDYASVMHYGEKDFAIDKDKPTIVPLKKGVKIGQRDGFSEIDILKINSLYNCSKNDTGSPVSSRSGHASEIYFTKEVFGRSQSKSPKDWLELFRPLLFLWQHFVIEEQEFNEKSKSFERSRTVTVSLPTTTLVTTSALDMNAMTTSETTNSLKTENMALTKLSTVEYSDGETTTTGEDTSFTAAEGIGTLSSILEEMTNFEATTDGALSSKVQLETTSVSSEASSAATARSESEVAIVTTAGYTMETTVEATDGVLSTKNMKETTPLASETASATVKGYESKIANQTTERFVTETATATVSETPTVRVSETPTVINTLQTMEFDVTPIEAISATLTTSVNTKANPVTKNVATPSTTDILSSHFPTNKEETTAAIAATTFISTIKALDPVTNSKTLFLPETTSKSIATTNTEQITVFPPTVPTSKCNPFTKLLQTLKYDATTLSDPNETMFPPDSRKHVINYHRITIIETVKFRTAVKNTKKLWGGGIVPYIFSDKYDEMQKELMLDAMAEFHNKTCIQFVRRTKEISYIFIAPEDRCSSTVGDQEKDINRVSIGDNCYAKGTLMHEFMHVLGFVHEQNRPDRDRFVIIMFDNIIPRFRRNFRKYNWSQVQDLGIEYDYSSVMHYEAFDFAVDESRPTIVALEQGIKLGQREGFSQKDIIKINKLYNCPVQKQISKLGEESLSAIDEFKKYFSSTISRLFRNVQRIIRGFKPR